MEGGAIKANQPGLPGMPGMPGPAPMMPRVIMPQGFQVGLPAGMAAALPYNPYNPMQRANIPVVPPVPVVAHRLPPIPVRAPIIHRPRNNAQPNRKRKRG